MSGGPGAGPAVAVAVAVAVVSLLSPACGADPAQRLSPTCRNVNTLVLEAQSVPEAQLLPCVSLLPAGWDVTNIEIKSGRSRFSLDSDRAGVQALVVTLTSRCDLAGATEIPSDEPGTRRYERIESLEGGYRGMRFYTFPGGCTSYRLRFAEPGRALVNEASLALTFVRRSTVAAELQRRSGGRLSL